MNNRWTEGYYVGIYTLLGSLGSEGSLVVLLFFFTIFQTPLLGASCLAWQLFPIALGSKFGVVKVRLRLLDPDLILVLEEHFQL